MVKIIVLLILGFVAIQSAQGLKCYNCTDCTSVTDKESIDCAHSTNKLTNKVPKDSADFFCATAKVKFNNSDTLIRGCATFDDICKASQYIQECTLCKSNNCNGAGSIQSWAFTALIVAALFKLFF